MLTDFCAVDCLCFLLANSVLPDTVDDKVVPAVEPCSSLPVAYTTDLLPTDCRGDRLDVDVFGKTLALLVDGLFTGLCRFDDVSSPADIVAVLFFSYFFFFQNKWWGREGKSDKSGL